MLRCFRNTSPGYVSDTGARAAHHPRMDECGTAATASQTFTVICAWCGRELSHGAPLVSHGICPSCSEELVAQARRLRRQAAAARA